MEVQAKAGDETHRLRVFFPDVYPYTRFEVLAPDLDLPRHQNPFQKNLCLVGRATANWNVDDTLADFLVTRFPHVVSVARSKDVDYQRDEEEPQGEPYSDHYLYGEDSAVLIDSAWRIDPAIRRGKLKLGLDGLTHPVRGAVLEVQAPDGTPLAHAHSSLQDRYRHIVWGRWIRRTEPVQSADPHGFLNVLVADDKDLREKRASSKKPPPPDIIGVIFQEEVQQGAMSDGWVFLARAENGITLARAARAGPDDVSVRAPEMAPLRNRRVAIVGLGSLGAPCAIGLARCGVGELMLADFDFVEAGTISRWPLGLNAVGRRKANVLREFIQANYPYTKVTTSLGVVGGSLDPGYSDLDALDKLLDADLLLDATAEVGIQHLLSDLATERKKAYICASTTAGAWGGLIARMRPGATHGCWVCLQHALSKGEVPTPATKPDGFVQPPGCASPTFTGAGFDTAAIADAAVRLTAMTLCGDHASWDVEVLDFRDDAGARIPSRTRSFPLNRQAECNNANAHDQGVGAA
jgi:molybdopterin/thiamine biosynthesis adenylyltransferase